MDVCRLEERLNAKKLYEKMNDRMSTVKFLQSLGVIGDICVCSDCGVHMKFFFILFDNFRLLGKLLSASVS